VDFTMPIQQYQHLFHVPRSANMVGYPSFLAPLEHHMQKTKGPKKVKELSQTLTTSCNEKTTKA